MKKIISKDKTQAGLIKRIENLLSEQTGIILSAVDQKVAKLEKRIDDFDFLIYSAKIKS